MRLADQATVPDRPTAVGAGPVEIEGDAIIIRPWLMARGLVYSVTLYGTRYDYRIAADGCLVTTSTTPTTAVR